MWKRRRGCRAVAERVKIALIGCTGVAAIRVISHVCCGGYYIVLVDAKSLGSSIDIEYTLEDAFGKQYAVHNKVDGVIVRVSVVGSEMHQQALRYSITFFSLM